MLEEVRTFLKIPEQGQVRYTRIFQRNILGIRSRQILSPNIENNILLIFNLKKNVIMNEIIIDHES